MLTQRMPPSLSNFDSTLVNSKILLRAVWQREHALVYQILRHSTWPDIMKPLIQRYEGERRSFSYIWHMRELTRLPGCFQRETFIQLSNAYEAITPATAAKHLGLDSDSQSGMHNGTNGMNGEVQGFEERLVQRGWTWDAQSKLLRPNPIRRQQVGGQLDQGSLSQLVGWVGHLNE